MINIGLTAFRTLRRRASTAYLATMSDGSTLSGAAVAIGEQGDLANEFS